MQKSVLRSSRDTIGLRARSSWRDTPSKYNNRSTSTRWYLQHGVVVAESRMMMPATSRAFMRMRQRRRLRRQSRRAKTADRRRFVHRAPQLVLGQLVKIRQGTHRYHPRRRSVTLRLLVWDASSRATRSLARSHFTMTVFLVRELVTYTEERDFL